MTRALALAFVLLSACKTRAPALALECVAHQDCGMIALGPDCCDLCEPRIGNRKSIDALAAWCSAHPPTKPCPELKCAGSAFTAFCEREACMARPGIH